MKKSVSSFLILLIVLFITACSGEPSVVTEISGTDQSAQLWADSVLGELDEYEKYQQHLLIEVPKTYEARIDSLTNWLAVHKPGFISLENWHADSVSRLKNRLDTLMAMPPVFYGNYFGLIGGKKTYPFWEVSSRLRDPEHLKAFAKSGYQLLNFGQSINPTKLNHAWLDSLRSKLGIIPISGSFNDRDAQKEFDRFLRCIDHSTYAIQLELEIFDTVKLDQYRTARNFEGLFVVKSVPSKSNLLLTNGADVIYYPIESKPSFDSWNSNVVDYKFFEESTRRILAFKRTLKVKREKNVNIAAAINFTRTNYQAYSTALLKNEGKIIPLKSKATVYSQVPVDFRQKIRTECGISLSDQVPNEANIEKLLKSKGTKIFILSDTCSQEIYDAIDQIRPDKNTVIAFSDPNRYAQLKQCPNLIFTPVTPEFDGEIFVQQLTSRIPLTADFYSGDSLFTGIKLEKKLLARTEPGFVGLDKDTLSRIAWLMENCMTNHAFPGGQVLIAKNGCIVYDRVFGKHTYQGDKLVTENSMYDLASLTKVVSTTLVGMKLYEMGLYEMDDSLSIYLPDSLSKHLEYPSTIRHITFQELYTHTSGLPAGFPIIKYMRYTSSEVGRFDRYFCDRPDSVYLTEVAEGFYLEREQQDSMWLRMNQIYLNPQKPYNYSDVNMNLLYMMLKSFIDKDPAKFGFTQPKKQLKDKNLFEEFLYNTFYKPLGMSHTCYRPLKRYSRDNIVPTENETYWRKQLLHGHVHDPNAALHGGVAGNAGIFSTTNDLVILFQMWLNKGVYNGQRYLNAETIDKFTARQENCFRGLGFNKPSMGATSFGMSENASSSTYGHTGFTGTAFWIDPEHQLIYIYLSNAVHPSVNNKTYEYGIRKKVHQCAYDAMILENF